MQIELRIRIASDAESFGGHTAYYTFDADFAPSKDIMFGKPPLEDFRKVEGISYDCETGQFGVYLGVLKVGTKEEREKLTAEFAECGWNVR